MNLDRRRTVGVGEANGLVHGCAPGERPYHPGYYAAFVLDPNGNNIDTDFHGDARRSRRPLPAPGQDYPLGKAR